MYKRHFSVRVFQKEIILWINILEKFFIEFYTKPNSLERRKSNLNLTNAFKKDLVQNLIVIPLTQKQNPMVNSCTKMLCMKTPEASYECHFFAAIMGLHI